MDFITNTHGKTVPHDGGEVFAEHRWLASPLQTNVRLESQKTKDFKKEGAGNGPHN